MKKLIVPLVALLSIIAPLATRGQSSPAATLTTLHSFTGDDGAYPFGGLALGSDGNFYGTTLEGIRLSANGGGTIYKITPAGTLTALHSAPAEDGFFSNNGGAQYRSELTQGNDGSFYGTASSGGTLGGGTVFKVSATGAYTTLFNFDASSTEPNGNHPFSTVIQGRDGNFYGTTYSGGGVHTGGTIFKITPAGALTTLHRFSQTIYGNPVGKLVQGSDGNFYGTTNGNAGEGSSVFKMTPAGEFTTLHAFEISQDGTAINAGLVEGNDGNFYGVASDAGSTSYYGTVFKITPSGDVTVLHKFGSGPDAYPSAALIRGQDGKFYGTTFSRSGASGTVFSITPDGAQFTRLYTFSGSSDGAAPSGILVQTSDGSFYGTTAGGGTSGKGTVFKLTLPPLLPPFANIATRLKVETGDNAAIAGFIVKGAAGAMKKVLIRGLGPSLAQYGVTGALSDPILELRDNIGGNPIINDNWQTGDTSQIPANFQTKIDPRDSIIVASLPVGSTGSANYTAVLKGVNNATGIALVEVYDLDDASTSKLQLANIATRGLVQQGDSAIIAGIIVGGSNPVNVLLRVTGPALKDFGIANALGDPILELHDSNGNTTINDNWRATQEAEINATGLAPAKDLEPAIKATLAPGNYTAIARGTNNTTGVAVVEAYKLP